MAIIEKKRNASKYSNLSDEERKQKYKEHSLEWYTKKTPEEKKIIQDKKKGVCDICKTERVYVNLPEHRRSQAHKRNVEKLNESIIIQK